MFHWGQVVIIPQRNDAYITDRGGYKSVTFPSNCHWHLKHDDQGRDTQELVPVGWDILIQKEHTFFAMLIANYCVKNMFLLLGG